MKQKNRIADKRREWWLHCKPYTFVHRMPLQKEFYLQFRVTYPEQQETSVGTLSGDGKTNNGGNEDEGGDSCGRKKIHCNLRIVYIYISYQLTNWIFYK